MAAPLARRYASAYFELAKQAGKIPEWGNELARAKETIDDPRLIDALANPRLRRRERVQLSMDVLDGVDVPARNLVRLMLEHGRIKLLGEVVEYYEELKQRESGVIRGVVAAAHPLSQQQSSQIASTLSKELGRTVQIEVKHTPEIIGGLVIHIGDRVIDNSVRTHLTQLQESFA